MKAGKIIGIAMAAIMSASIVTAYAAPIQPKNTFDASLMDTEDETSPWVAQVDAIAETLEVGTKDESYTGDINIYATYGTLPTLYALLNLYKDIDDAAKDPSREPAKSYMWYIRGNTANPERLPDNVTIMAPLTESQTYNADYMLRFMAYARKLYATYPNAHFNLFCDDLRAQQEILFFNFNHIPAEQYNVNLLSDGTGSYSSVKKYLYKESNPDDVDKMAGTKNNWNNLNYWYNEYKRRAEAGTLQDDARFLNNNMGAMYIMYPAATQDNIKYYLQWPELMISDDPETNTYINELMNMEKQFPSDIYNELTTESRNAFLEAVFTGSEKTKDLTKAQFDEYFKGIENGKKYMIISGTSPGGEGSDEAKSFENRVAALMDYFKDENYTYLYKPHPSWPASAVSGREEFLNSKGIVELPAQTPMEVILTAYPDVDLGGYNSSLYMSATGEHVKFFFADSVASLVAPLPDLYNMGMYPEAVFFNPTATKIPVPTAVPTLEPTTAPTVAPTIAPTTAPTVAPTVAPTTAPSDYPYEITSLAIKNQTGEALDDFPATGFVVEANVKKNVKRDEKDYLFVAAYDVTGELLSLDYVQAQFAEGYDYSFGFFIPSSAAYKGQRVDKVKAYVWDGFGSAKPLAEAKQLMFHRASAGE